MHITPSTLVIIVTVSDDSAKMATIQRAVAFYLNVYVIMPTFAEIQSSSVVVLVLQVACLLLFVITASSC